jgi:site-specific recombinase XerD
MTTLAEYAEDYLRLRRALGFKLDGYNDPLASFAAYVEATGAGTVPAELAEAWARRPAGIKPITASYRIGWVRGFARYLHAIDPAHEVPPPGLLSVPRRRPTPYLYSPEDVLRILARTRRLRPPLHAATYETLFGLLAATGMRVGEALALTRRDVALVDGILTIRHPKFNRMRLVPLHPSTTDALRRYALARDHLCRDPRTDRFFHIDRVIGRQDAERVFLKITEDLGLRTDTAHPRLHDLRHTFAVRTLIDWQRDRRRPRDAAGAVDLSRPHRTEEHLLVSVRDAAADATGCRPARATLRRPIMTALAPLLQAFFTDRLAQQRHASPHTVLSYRDAFRLLLDYAAHTTGKKPSALEITDLDAPLIAAFLDHLEHERRNSVRTRNNRLAAIHSLFSYAALHHPEHAESIARVLAIPVKRSDRTMLTWLTDTEVDALLASPDLESWTGRRDHALLALAIQTGLRISELISLTHADVQLGAGAHVRCMGKGRKERATPLTKHTVAVLRVWTTEHPGASTTPLFPTRTGATLSRDAVEHRLAAHLAIASTICPSLRGKRVTMHTLRHTAAMRLLRSGTDTAIIALWLGHRTTHDRPDLPPRRHGTKGASNRQAHPARHPPRSLPAPRPTAGLPTAAVIMPTRQQRSPRAPGDPKATSA